MPRSSAAAAEITIPASKSSRTRRRCCSVWLKVTESSSMGGQSHRTLRTDVSSERPQADDRLLQSDKATTTIEVLRAGAPGAALTIGPPQPVAPPRRRGRGTIPRDPSVTGFLGSSTGAQIAVLDGDAELAGRTTAQIGEDALD
jgi:hypothetical protein